MPALNFRKEFADKIESGVKRQTMRAPRRDGRPIAKPGDWLYLFVGMRTRNCRRLGTMICSNTAQVVLTESGDIIVNGKPIRGLAAENQFATRDGFAGADEMLDWFKEVHGLPFYGSLIEWTKP